MNQTPLYLIPGLGADARIFDGLKEQGLKFTVLEFIQPKKGESLKEYAHRLAEPIDLGQPYRLGGVSLGGMISTEIAELAPPEQLILISTLKSSKEFPFYLKLFRYIPLHKLMSGKMIKRLAPENPFKTKPEIRKVLRQMRQDADPQFVHWALNAAIQWRKPQPPQKYVHVHGSRDPLFPPLFIKDKVTIAKGAHVMVMEKPQAIYQVILEKA